MTNIIYITHSEFYKARLMKRTSKILGPKVSQKLDVLIPIDFSVQLLEIKNFQALLDNQEINNMTNQELFKAITENPDSKY